MKSRILAYAVAVIIVTASGIEHCNAAWLSMSPYGSAGDTQVYRGDVTTLGPGIFDTVIITDRFAYRGADGVFSGFDADFVVFDIDGDLNTTADQFSPFENASTFVTAGAVRNPATSPYQPTAAHPGILFGLNLDSSIDFATATLAVRDAQPLIINGDVDSCDGFVTLGDGGVLTATFSPITAGGGSLYLFVGEAGGNEPLCGVQVNVIPEPATIVLLGLGGFLLRRKRR